MNTATKPKPAAKRRGRPPKHADGSIVPSLIDDLSAREREVEAELVALRAMRSALEKPRT